MIRFSALTRPALALSIALCAASAHADVAFGNITDLLRDVTGTATLAIAATGTGAPLSITRSVSFTNTGSAMVSEHPGAFTVEAGSDLDHTFVTISTGYAASPPYTAVSATTDATWSGMLVNPFSTAQRFTISGSLNFDSNLRGSSYSTLKIGSVDVALYGADVDIGVLAPGAGIKVSMVSHAEGTFTTDFDGAFYGSTGGGSSLNGYSARAVSPVPEPATWALFAGGLIGLVVLKRRRD